MARRRSSPYGTTRTGYVYDSTRREYINTRTGELTSAADALKSPTPSRTRLRSGALSYDYKAESGKVLHGDKALDIVRHVAEKFPRGTLIIIRGDGGTEEYGEDWWSSPPTEVEDILDMDDEELSDFLYGITDDGPAELDIYIRED